MTPLHPTLSWVLLKINSAQILLIRACHLFPVGTLSNADWHHVFRSHWFWMPLGKRELSNTCWTQAPWLPVLTLLAHSCNCLDPKAFEAETLGYWPLSKTTPTSTSPKYHHVSGEGTTQNSSITPSLSILTQAQCGHWFDGQSGLFLDSLSISESQGLTFVWGCFSTLEGSILCQVTVRFCRTQSQPAPLWWLCTSLLWFIQFS